VLKGGSQLRRSRVESLQDFCRTAQATSGERFTATTVHSSWTLAPIILRQQWPPLRGPAPNK